MAILTPVSWNIDKRRMFVELYERQETRFASWKVFLLDRFFPLPSLKYPAVIGTFSWTSSAIRRKWIMKSQAVLNGGTWVTPGDIARDYLSIKYHDRRIRCTTDQYNKCVKDRRNTPVFCYPCTLEHGYYVDIKSAYWTICQAVGWDCNYNPGKFLAAGASMHDFPFPDNKMARNCLVSVGLPGGMRFWNGSTLSFQKKPNRFVNLILWRLVCDVLNEVAFECREAGAVYGYTDGFIVDDKHLADVFDVLDSWNLPYSIKREGRAIVRAPADYEIDGHKTNVIPRKVEITMNKTYSEHRTWLKHRLFVFSSRRSRDYGKHE